MRVALEVLLARHRDLEICPIRTQVLRHPGHDPAVLRQGHDFLRPYLRLARYALVMFDRDGCGRPDAREDLERLAEARLSQNGWEGRCSAVVIDPELEAWFWTDSPHVEGVLRWTNGRARLEEWLEREGFRDPSQQKPHRPKEAVEALLTVSKTPRTSSIYRELAKQVRFQRCTDLAFLKLKRVLKHWFPEEGSIGEH